MLSVLTTNWWALAIRGILAVIFGILAFLWPGLTLTVLVLVFGVYAIADGIFSIVTAVARSDRATEGDWVLLLEGIPRDFCRGLSLSSGQESPPCSFSI